MIIYSANHTTSLHNHQQWIIFNRLDTSNWFLLSSCHITSNSQATIKPVLSCWYFIAVSLSWMKMIRINITAYKSIGCVLCSYCISLTVYQWDYCFAFGIKMSYLRHSRRKTNRGLLNRRQMGSPWTIAKVISLVDPDLFIILAL